MIKQMIKKITFRTNETNCNSYNSADCTRLYELQLILYVSQLICCDTFHAPPSQSKQNHYVTKSTFMDFHVRKCAFALYGVFL